MDNEKYVLNENEIVIPASTPVAVVVLLLLILFTIGVVWGIMVLKDKITGSKSETVEVVSDVSNDIGSSTEDWSWVEEVAFTKPAESLMVSSIDVRRISEDVLNVTVMYSGIPSDGCTFIWGTEKGSLLKFCETNRGTLEEVDILSGGEGNQFSVGEEGISVYLNGSDSSMCVGYVFTGSVGDWKSFVDTSFSLQDNFYFSLYTDMYTLDDEVTTLSDLLGGL